MPKGQADFGMYAVKETIASLSDMAELAARLGSIVTYDRRGDVIWLDDFEGGIECWKRVVSGDDGAIEWVADAKHSGGFSAKLIAGKTDDHNAAIERVLFAPALSKIGLEVSVATHLSTSYLQLMLIVYTGTHGFRFILTYGDVNNRWFLHNSGGGDTIFATDITYNKGDAAWQTFKFVIDLVTGKYVRAILGGVTYDLSAYDGYTETLEATPYMRFYIVNTGREGYNDYIFIDDVILTQNEP